MFKGRCPGPEAEHAAEMQKSGWSTGAGPLFWDPHQMRKETDFFYVRVACGSGWADATAPRGADAVQTPIQRAENRLRPVCHHR